MIRDEEIGVLFQKLKPRIAAMKLIANETPVSTGGGSSGGGATAFSQLTGTIGDSQAPQFLKRDGSRSLTGNLAVDTGVTLDGVQLATFKGAYDVHIANPDAHHARSHGLLSAADHFVVGLTTNQVLKATSTTTFGFGSVAHPELTNVLPDQHHNQVHNILGTDHTYSGGAALDLFGLTAASTIGKLTPSSNPGAGGSYSAHGQRW